MLLETESTKVIGFLGTSYENNGVASYVYIERRYIGFNNSTKMLYRHDPNLEHMCGTMEGNINLLFRYIHREYNLPIEVAEYV